MKIIEKFNSNDGKALKYLQVTQDEYITETAYINDVNRHIICFSSQIGCPVKCKICHNGINGSFYRNLYQDELFEECVNIVENLNLTQSSKPILFSAMGVGEPLLNYDNVFAVMLELNKKYPNSMFALATTIPDLSLISRLAQDVNALDSFKLTVSLHAPSDDLRKSIIPIHKSLSLMKSALNEYSRISKHEYEWNYVLLKDYNDSDMHAQELSDFLGEGEHVKITQFNPIDNCAFLTSDRAKEFSKILKDYGIMNYIFTTDGHDIASGCGQMISKHINKNSNC